MGNSSEPKPSRAFRHLKRTESPAQPVLLQDKLRLRIRTGPIRTAEVRLRVRVGDSKGSTCPAGRAPVRRRRAREGTESGDSLLRRGSPPRRSRGSGGEGAQPRGQRQQRGPTQRPAALGALPIRPARPHRLSSTRSPARRSLRRRGPTSDAAAGTEGQRSAAAATPPLCDTAYQSLAGARVALQSVGSGAGPDRRMPAVARKPRLPLRSVVVVG